VLQVEGLQGKTSIKATPYGTLFQCCPRAAGSDQVQRRLRAIGPRSECVAGGGGGLASVVYMRCVAGCPPADADILVMLGDTIKRTARVV
jgi:hypothetical protein